MNKELDDLLQKMNDSMKGRTLENIPISDNEPFWDARKNYMKALHEADGVHVPASAEVEVPKEEPQVKKGVRSLEEQLADLEVTKTVQ